MAKRTNNKGFIRGIIIGLALMWLWSHKDAILNDIYIDMKYSYYVEQINKIERIHVLHDEWIKLFNTLKYLDAQR